MKLIIFQPGHSKASFSGYKNSVKIAFMLNANVACAGISEQAFRMVDMIPYYNFDQRVEVLSVGGSYHKKIVSDIIGNYKELEQLDKRSTKSIEKMELVEKEIAHLFEKHMHDLFNKYEKWFGLKTMRPLLNEEYFYFYHLSQNDKVYYDSTITEAIDLLLLNLPDPENGTPIFLINTENQIIDRTEFLLQDPLSDAAAGSQNCYGSASFVFPNMDLLPTNEIRLGRKQLEGPTHKFRKLINEWAEICYGNPNSNLGLEFFRENLMEQIETLEKMPQEAYVLEKAAETADNNGFSRIMIAQVPIEQIWRRYFDSNAITEVEFEHLIEMKAKQYPKYEGRWPVFLYEILPDNYTAANASPTHERTVATKKIHSH